MAGYYTVEGRLPFAACGAQRLWTHNERTSSASVVLIATLDISSCAVFVQESARKKKSWADPTTELRRPLRNKILSSDDSLESRMPSFGTSFFGSLQPTERIRRARKMSGAFMRFT